MTQRLIVTTPERLQAAIAHLDLEYLGPAVREFLRDCEAAQAPIARSDGRALKTPSPASERFFCGKGHASTR